jgi:hypothetical protein
VLFVFVVSFFFVESFVCVESFVFVVLFFFVVSFVCVESFVFVLLFFFVESLLLFSLGFTSVLSPFIWVSVERITGPIHCTISICVPVSTAQTCLLR